MTDTPALRLMVVDDHPVFRDGLQMLLDSMSDIEVVGAAADGHAALVMASELQPDVVIMDLQMPGMSGIEATARLTHEQPHVAVLVLTMYEDDDSVFAAMRAGARGYILKGASQDVIARAVAAVADGEAIFGPAVARRVADYFATSPSSAAPVEVFPQLTSREKDVLQLIAAGRTNAQIAQALFLSPKTIRNNVSNIFAKLQVAGRSEAIVRARQAGFGL